MKVKSSFIIVLISSVVNAAQTTTRTVSKRATTLTYHSNASHTFSYTMHVPSGVNKMTLVCATTSATEKEYCTEVVEPKEGLIYDCYDYYNSYGTNRFNEVNYCSIYTQKLYTLMKPRKICNDYYYVAGSTVTSEEFCITKSARYGNPTLVPLEPGYTYTSDTLKSEEITFPVPEEVAAVTIKCELSPAKDEYYNVFVSTLGYVYEKPTSVPFSIVNQEYTTVDNPDFTTTFTSIKSTKTVTESPTSSTTKTIKTGPKDIHMGELVTEDSGEITTKLPVVAATLNYCDEKTQDLCYGIYAVTDTCTIFTRASATKTVPENYITDTAITAGIEEEETPDITPADIDDVTTITTTTETEAKQTTTTETSEEITFTIHREKPIYCKNVFEQCGGKGYTGQTQCCEGSKCIALGEYYHQCLPR